MFHQKVKFNHAKINKINLQYHIFFSAKQLCVAKFKLNVKMSTICSIEGHFLDKTITHNFFKKKGFQKRYIF